MATNTAATNSDHLTSDTFHDAPADPSENAIPSTAQLYHNISSYPFNTDTEYLVGLATILGHPDTPPTDSELRENQDLVLQAQCFYLVRKYNLPNIDVEDYKRWLFAQPTPTPTSAASDTATASEPIKELAAIINGAGSPSQLNNHTSTTDTEIPSIDPGNTRSPIPDRPHAPTPSTAAAATTLSVQPHQQIPSPAPPTSIPNPNPQPEAEPTPPYPTTFAEIVDLITQNKPIPGIETIPDTVLDAGSSKADRATRRQKPWERDPLPNPDIDTSLDQEIGESKIDVETRKTKVGDGVLKILQPGAVPDSGLVAKEDDD